MEFNDSVPSFFYPAPDWAISFGVRERHSASRLRETDSRSIMWTPLHTIEIANVPHGMPARPFPAIRPH